MAAPDPRDAIRRLQSEFQRRASYFGVGGGGGGGRPPLRFLSGGGLAGLALVGAWAFNASLYNGACAPAACCGLDARAEQA